MLLKVEHLKTYLRSADKTVKAVDDVTFHIGEGETFCLVGESGSGKSITALSIMQLLPAGISSHPAGCIYLKQPAGAPDPGGYIDTLTLPERQLRTIRGARLAMIFQEPMTSLNPVFTIGDQIIEALQLHNPDMSHAEARERTIHALTQVKMPNATQRVDDYPHHLSGGQRQRVMIAMAMACEPDLLIADEPTTALDVTVQKEILNLMQDLQARNHMGILFITHDFGVVCQIGHRLAVMHRGKIVETGTLAEVLKQPKHTYTKQLLASLPQNLKRQQHRVQTPSVPGKPLDSKIDNAGQTLVDLRQLCVYFPVKRGLLHRTVDHIKAVDAVDVRISQGQILALVGESGCGKTTLGRAILRLIEPSAGDVLFSGINITQLRRSAMRPYRSRMQIIFQDPMSSLNPRLSIATTLTEPMAVHGIGDSHEERLEIARQTLHQVQLEAHYLWRYPHEFSGGQRQRIGIARALVLNPRFIVCDEVTSSLDVSVQAEILQMLLELRRSRQLTLLFITHDISVVEYISDETAVMYRGRIVERGATTQICGNPRHEYTQTLLSAVPRIMM